jgi:hypothetical protein
MAMRLTHILRMLGNLVFSGLPRFISWSCFLVGMLSEMARGTPFYVLQVHKPRFSSFKLGFFLVLSN